MFTPTFIEHRGCRILRLDYSQLTGSELAAAAMEVRRLVASAPAGTLRILTLLRTTPLTAGNAAVLKDAARANAPYVRAGAVVGTAFWNVMVADLQAHGRPDVIAFEHEADALDWLASA